MSEGTIDVTLGEILNITVGGIGGNVAPLDSRNGLFSTGPAGELGHGGGDGGIGYELTPRNSWKGRPRISTR